MNQFTPSFSFGIPSSSNGITATPSFSSETQAAITDDKSSSATNATTNVSFPPMSGTAPMPFGSTLSAIPNDASSDAFPPMASKAPTPFGSPADNKPSNNVALPPMATKMPPFDNSTDSAAPNKTNNDPLILGTPSTESYRDRLIEFYQKYNPSKLDTVNATLDKYRGKEEQMFKKLQEKYISGKDDGLLPPSGDGPKCYVDFSVDGTSSGRVVFKLYQDKAPLAVENFRALCTGEKGKGRSSKDLCYRGSKVHRIVPNFVVQMGDFIKGDGTGGESIYPPNSEHGDMWGKFKDETPFLKHARKGLLSMANNGPNTNGSQFFITLKATPHLNAKHVVFGEVVSGMEIIDNIGTLETDKEQRPLKPVVVDSCGQLGEHDNEITAAPSTATTTSASQPFGFGAQSSTFGSGVQASFFGSLSSTEKSSSNPFASFSFGNSASTAPLSTIFSSTPATNKPNVNSTAFPPLSTKAPTPFSASLAVTSSTSKPKATATSTAPTPAATGFFSNAAPTGFSLHGNYGGKSSLPQPAPVVSELSFGKTSGQSLVVVAAPIGTVPATNSTKEMVTEVPKSLVPSFYFGQDRNALLPSAPKVGEQTINMQSKASDGTGAATVSIPAPTQVVANTPQVDVSFAAFTPSFTPRLTQSDELKECPSETVDEAENVTSAATGQLSTATPAKSMQGESSTLRSELDMMKSQQRKTARQCVTEAKPARPKGVQRGFFSTPSRKQPRDISEAVADILAERVFSDDDLLSHVSVEEVEKVMALPVEMMIAVLEHIDSIEGRGESFTWEDIQIAIKESEGVVKALNFDDHSFTSYEDFKSCVSRFTAAQDDPPDIFPGEDDLSSTARGSEEDMVDDKTEATKFTTLLAGQKEPGELELLIQNLDFIE